MFENSNFKAPSPTSERSYRDISLKEPKFLSTEEEVLEQYIQTLLVTRSDSIPFEDFGINLEEYLFTLPNPIYCDIIFDRVVRAVRRYIPGIKIDFSKSGVKIDPKDDSQYILTLVVYTKSGKDITIKKNLGMNMVFKEQ